MVGTWFKQLIAELNEDQLRKSIMLPLLSEMGFRDITEHHGGSAEKGKDIVCSFLDRMGEKRHLAVVLKRGNIHGSASKRGSAGQACIQAQQALNDPFIDPYSAKPVSIDECWIVASGSISNTAMESVRGLLSDNLGKLLRFVDGKKMCELMHAYIPGFWNQHLSLMISHDTRAGLAAVLAQLSYIRASHEKMDKGRLDRLLDDAIKRGTVISMLSEAHLLIDQLSQKTSLLQHSDMQMDIRQSLSHWLNVLQGGLETKHLGVDFQIETLRTVRIDKHLMDQILFNTLQNAIQYSYPGTKIILRTSETQGACYLSVIDFGIGIPEEDLEAIWRPGYRSKSAVNYCDSGAGMGLYVVSKVMDAIGGSIECESQQIADQNITLLVAQFVEALMNVNQVLDLQQGDELFKQHSAKLLKLTSLTWGQMGAYRNLACAPEKKLRRLAQEWARKERTNFLTSSDFEFSLNQSVHQVEFKLKFPKQHQAQ